MAVADGNGLPIAIHTTAASPHEVTLVEDTITKCIIADEYPTRLIGDKAYDSDALDYRLATEYGIELIAPHRYNRRNQTRTQDGRVLRRYCRRWKIERMFGWLQNFRRIAMRHDYYSDNYLGFVQLGCMMILMGRCL
jgi:transposase